jgi:hypothetical protein
MEAVWTEIEGVAARTVKGLSLEGLYGAAWREMGLRLGYLPRCGDHAAVLPEERQGPRWALLARKEANMRGPISGRRETEHYPYSRN